MRTVPNHLRRRLTALLGAGALTGGVLAASPAQSDETDQAAVPRCAGEKATIVGTEGDDVLQGTQQKQDVIVGLGGNDTLQAVGSDDILCGGDGDDVLSASGTRTELIGGAGDDRMEGGNRDESFRPGPGDDQVTAGRGSDSIEVSSGNDRVDAGPGKDDLWPVQNKAGIEARFTAPGTGTMTREGLSVTFTGIDNVDGTRFDDVIIGSTADEWFVAGGAHDQGDLVEGGGGNDNLQGTGVVRGGTGNDEIDANGTADGGPGNDKVRSGPGRLDDTLIGGSGDDRINLAWAKANATVRAGRGNDSIVFGRPVEPNPGKRQRLDGGPGRDYLDFHDRYYASPRLRIDLGHGRARSMNDTWRGRLIGIEDVRGSASDDRILGDGSGNRLDGGDGRDYVNGRGGRDTCRAEKTVNCER